MRLRSRRREALQVGNANSHPRAEGHAVGANIGIADRAIRIVPGHALDRAIFPPDQVARRFGPPGMAPLLAGTVSFCPLCTVRGIRTCQASEPLN
jgi:Protein of unknown function (DUF2892)